MENDGKVDLPDVKIKIIKKIRKRTMKLLRRIKVAVLNTFFPVRKDVEMLRRQIFATQRIDLVEIDGFCLFVYMDDFFYRCVVRAEGKNRTPLAIKRAQQSTREIAGSGGSIDEFIAGWKSTEDADLLLLAQFVKSGRPFTLLDVGCLYGRTALRYGRFLRTFSCQAPVLCFDPGNAGALAPCNFVNNGYPEFQFQPYAIGDVDGFVLMHLEVGQNENNRIINRAHARYATSRVVPARRLDSIMKDRDGDIFVKIDTQGAEFEVFAGLSECIGRRTVAGLMEFFPAGLATRVRPETFLARLLETFIIFDIGAGHGRLERVTPQNAPLLVSKLKGQSFPYTDLLFFPQNMEGAEDLARRLGSMEK